MPDGGLWLRSPESQRADFQALCALDPVYFAQEVLGVKLWSKQRAILRSVRDNPRTAVKSCHASGKSFVSAVAVCWFLACHPHCIVATTAPTYRQVEKVLWAEVRVLWKRAIERGFPMPGRIYGTEIRIDDKWTAFGFSTDNPDRFQGLHAPYILVVLDEASGIPPEMWAGVEGVLSGGHARLLSIGNPTDPAAMFASEYASLPGSARFTISAFDTPNLKAGKTLVPGLVTPEWVEDKRKRWGEKSPLWQSRVLGNFPSQGVDTLIPLGWIEAAQNRWHETPDGDTSELGADVARFGDDESVMAHRRGDKVRIVFEANGIDTMDYAGRIIRMGKELCCSALKVDIIGIGAGVVDRIREEQRKDATIPPVFAMNVSTGPRDQEQFLNAKAEWFWDLRERFREGRIALDPEDADTAHELSVLKYRFSGSRTVIEPKEETKKRLGRSPDRADAVMLAFAKPFTSEVPIVGAVPIAMPVLG